VSDGGSVVSQQEKHHGLDPDTHATNVMTQMGEPGGAGGSAVTAKKPVKLWPVRIDALEFTSDHHLMNDNVSDWTKAGSLLAKPEWQRQPRVRISITHSRLKQVTAEATFNVVNQAAATRDGVARGVSVTKILRVKADNSASFGPAGPTSVPVTSQHDLPDLVGHLIVSLGWEVESGGKAHAAGTSGGHTIYVTYGDPIDAGLVEDGVTLRRMEKAIAWLGRAWAKGKRKPVDLIDAVFSKFEGYILGFEMLSREQRVYLRKHPAALKHLQAAGFPAYLDNAKGGAWPLAQYVSYGGECQAIVRLTRAVAHQVGLTGTIEDKYVSSEPGDPYKTRVLSNPGVDPDGPSTLGAEWFALVDGPVAVGRSYGARDGVGFNRFEAFLKYTDPGGTVTWFGGGIGRLDSSIKETELVRVFWGLAACAAGPPDPASPGYVKSKIVKVWRYTPL